MRLNDKIDLTNERYIIHTGAEGTQNISDGNIYYIRFLKMIVLEVIAFGAKKKTLFLIESN